MLKRKNIPTALLYFKFLSVDLGQLGKHVNTRYNVLIWLMYMNANKSTSCLQILNLLKINLLDLHFNFDSGSWIHSSQLE